MIGPAGIQNAPFFCRNYNYIPYTSYRVPPQIYQPPPRPFLAPPNPGPMYPCIVPMPFIPQQQYGYIRPFLPSEHVFIVPPEEAHSPGRTEPEICTTPRQPIVTEPEEPDVPPPQQSRRPSTVADATVNLSSCTARYSGVGDVRTFLNTVLNFKNCAEISDETALKSFPLLLTDLAAVWWRNNKRTFTDWNSAIQQLRIHYRANPPPYKVYRHLVSSHERSVPAVVYIQRAKVLLSQLPPYTLTEDTELDLVYSLLSRRVRERVNRNHFHNFTQLLTLARQAEDELEEALRDNETPNSPAAPTSPVKQATTDSAPTSETNGQTSASDGGEDPDSPCHQCIMFGHLLKRMCQKIHNKSPEEHNLVKKTANVATLRTEKARKMICFRCKSLNIRRLKCEDCTTARVEPQKRPMLTVNIFGKNFEIVVDTGSRYSIASKDLTAHLIENKQDFTVDYLKMSFGGDILRQVFRIASVDVWVTGVAVQTSFVELLSARENVLGMDFIRDAGLVLDFRDEGTWTLRDVPEECPLMYEEINRDHSAT